MNEIANKSLLVDDKFMSELHLKQPGFTYSACGPFARNKERIEKCMQTRNRDFIYKTELDKAFSNMIWLLEIKKFCNKNSIRQSFKRSSI